MPDAINARTLCRCWLHSHEEDSEALRVYRPADFLFPPSRGREELELCANGIVRGKSPGPTDCGLLWEGAWKLEDKLLTVELPSSTREWRVIEASQVKLVVCRADCSEGCFSL